MGYEKILAYDPNDNYKEIWEVIRKYYPYVHFYNEIVYTYNGEIEYTQRPKEAPLGSTIMTEKRDWALGEVKKVKCVDILDLINEDCEIKLDGEGSEYDILERILTSDKKSNVKKVMVEWHGNKMSGEYEKRQAKIIRKLKRNKIGYELW